MKYCDKCGRQIEDNARFCGYCGRECKYIVEQRTHNGNRKRIQSVVLLVIVVIAFFIAVVIALPHICRKNTVSENNVETSVLGTYHAEDEGVLEEETFFETTEIQKTRRKLTKVNIYCNDVLCEEIVFAYNKDGLVVNYDQTYIREGASITDGSSTELLYDSQNRLVRSETIYSWMPNDIGMYTEYTYNSNGQLAYKSYGGMSGWSETAYEYDEHGRLAKSVVEHQIGTDTTVYLYDKNGSLIKTRTTQYNEETQEETISEDLNPSLRFDYKPFAIDESEDGFAGIMIPDVMGQAIWFRSFFEPTFFADDDGYLVRLDETNTYNETQVVEFLYDGEESKISLAHKDAEQKIKPQADGKLQYPISEEDCYIIFENYFGFDMAAEHNTVEVERMVEGGEEMLFFNIKMEFFEDEPPVTWGFFNVYVNTGVCTGGAMGHSDIWPVFQADDYYY